MSEPNPPIPQSAPQQAAPSVASAPRPSESSNGALTPPPNVVRPIRAVGAATRWLLLASAAVSLTALLNDSWGIGAYLVLDVGTVPVWTLQLYDAVLVALAFLTPAVLLATAIFWSVWQYRAAASLTPGSLRRSPGWHVGSWFIPIAMYWMPFQNVGDLARGSRARLRRGILGSWWATWIAGNLGIGIANQMYGRAETLPGLGAALTTSIFFYALQIISAVLAWIVVARITEAIEPRAARPVV